MNKSIAQLANELEIDLKSYKTQLDNFYKFVILAQKITSDDINLPLSGQEEYLAIREINKGETNNDTDRELPF